MSSYDSLQPGAGRTRTTSSPESINNVAIEKRSRESVNSPNSHDLSTQCDRNAAQIYYYSLPLSRSSCSISRAELSAFS